MMKERRRQRQKWVPKEEFAIALHPLNSNYDSWVVKKAMMLRLIWLFCALSTASCFLPGDVIKGNRWTNP
jgi:hypothetical protein